MKNQIIRRLLIVMLLTLFAALLLFPLLLPSENYFRMLLRLLPVAVLIGGVMLIPVFRLSERMSANIRSKLRHINMESPAEIASYPELKPLARQIMALKAQIAEQMDALTHQKEQLQVLTENMREGLILLDTKGRVLSANHAAMRLLGTDQPPEAGSVYDYNDAPAFYDVISSAVRGVHGETTLPIGDTVCQLIANPVAGDEGTNGAVLVLLDITEREKRDALRREFTSNVSHELKTPLTVIYGSADMLAGGLVKPEDVADFGSSIRSEADRLIKLIEDIVSLSKLDEDRVTEHEDVDLYELAGEVLRRLSPQAEKKNVTCLLSGSKVVYNGSRTILDEIITNLCSNAIKYNKEGGIVEIKTGQSGGKTTITVSDTGIGIAPANLKRIFERFYRADKSRSRKIEGTGLGLSIVKHGAEYHGGTVSAESTPGKGSIFTVTLP